MLNRTVGSPGVIVLNFQSFLVNCHVTCLPSNLPNLVYKFRKYVFCQNISRIWTNWMLFFISLLWTMQNWKGRKEKATRGDFIQPGNSYWCQLGHRLSLVFKFPGPVVNFANSLNRRHVRDKAFQSSKCTKKVWFFSLVFF